jgi:hypothetical protein
MTRQVRFMFREHPDYATAVPFDSDRDALTVIAQSRLTSDYLIARIGFLVSASNYQSNLETNWRLRDVASSGQPVIITVGEYMRRAPRALAIWLLELPDRVGSSIRELGASSSTRAMAELPDGYATEFLTSWTEGDETRNADIIDALSDRIVELGHEPLADEVRFVPPHTFLGVRRIAHLARRARLSIPTLVNKLMFRAAADARGTLEHDLWLIALGSSSMMSMMTSDGRRVLHDYANVPYPPPLRTPQDLARWLVAQGDFFTGGLQYLGRDGSLQAVAQLVNRAVSDEFLNNWLFATDETRAAILTSIAAIIGLAPPDELRFVAPDMFVAVRRFERLADLADLTPNELMTILHDPTAYLVPYNADIATIARGFGTGENLRTLEARRVLSAYSTPLPRAPQVPAPTTAVAARF